MNYKIKDYFKGSTSQLIALGKQASKLYRQQYNCEPEKEEDEDYGQVNVYPEELLEQLEKPVAKPVKDWYCSPVVTKGDKKCWIFKFKRFNEFETTEKEMIFGELIENFSYTETEYNDKIQTKLNFKLKAIDNTLHISMNDNYISREIVGTFLKHQTEVGDKLKVEIFDTETGWAKVLMKLNGQPIKNVKMDLETIKKIIDNR